MKLAILIFALCATVAFCRNVKTSKKFDDISGIDDESFDFPEKSRFIRSASDESKSKSKEDSSQSSSEERRRTTSEAPELTRQARAYKEMEF